MLFMIAGAVCAVVFFKFGVYSVTLTIMRVCIKALLWMLGLALVAEIWRRLSGSRVGSDDGARNTNDGSRIPMA